MSEELEPIAEENNESLYERVAFTVDKGQAPMRIDKWVQARIEGITRNKLQNGIDGGFLTVNGKVVKSNYKTRPGDEVVYLSFINPEYTDLKPEAMNLDIVYEDDGLLVVNKPAGLVVHPGAGNSNGTLLNALLHHYPDSINLVRAGIVHRLDKMTSGLLVVAKTEAVQLALTELLKDHDVARIYDAVVVGQMVSGGTVEAGIARHGTDRTKMTVNDHAGREATTHYRLVEKFRAHTHIRCQLETGRTHQIRVHMAHINFPLLGDVEYGRRLTLPRGMAVEDADVLRAFKRQALHASQLSFEHPLTGETMAFEVPLPADMVSLLAALHHDAQAFPQQFID
jgi:23S rRNA pseudouridine1911/1915/1917 synthase